jgi:sugar (pentulose or hexulose) kinase
MSEVAGDEVYLAVDCSTTAAKAVAFDPAGAVVASASRPLTLLHPAPTRYEQDARQWWEATRDAIADVVAQVDGGHTGPTRVRAVCLTHQRESFVCLDDADVPLRPAILWADGRAGAQIAALGSTHLHDLSGKPPDVTPALYKLAWLREHEPAVLAEATRIVDVHAYLAHELTGRWVTSQVSADTLGLFDLRRLTWSPELLALAGVRPEQLPEVCTSGEEAGRLDAAVAARLGLLPGGAAVPLIAGLGDGQAAGIGANVTGPGTAYLNLGTSMVLGVQTDSYQCDPAFRTLAGAIPGTFVLETILNSAAYLAGWFRAQFGDPTLRGAPDPALEAAAGALPPGAEGLLTLPYWNAAQTPYWDADARGATIGWHGGHTSAHLYRSILEAVGFELRLHLEGLEKATGQPVRTLRAMGGGSRSPLWAQLVADISQLPVEIAAEDEVSALGAAVIARAWASGRGAAGIPDAAAAMARTTRVVQPQVSLASTYERLFGVYRRVYPALRPVFAELAAAQESVPNR